MTRTVGDNVADRRRSYERADLQREDLAEDWLGQLRAWLEEVTASGEVAEPTAMVLATAAPDGTPSARTVLLKGLDETGLTLFTNLGSRKSRELAANPRASLVFSWVPVERQVVVCGRVHPVARELVEQYARSRPRGSQLGAWCSRQSEVIAGPEVLTERRAELAARWPEPEELPVPPFWGGWRVEPLTVEFWQGRRDRLHDRLRYRRLVADGQDGPWPQDWTVERLAP